MKPIPLIQKPVFLDLFISYEIASSKIYDKHEYFDLEIFNFPFADGDVPLQPTVFIFLNSSDLLESI